MVVASVYYNRFSVTCKVGAFQRSANPSDEPGLSDKSDKSDWSHRSANTDLRQVFPYNP